MKCTVNISSYKCKFCNSCFTKLSSLTRHHKNCVFKNDNLEEIKRINNEFDKYKEDTEQKIKQLEKDVEYFKGLVNNAGQIVNKSVTALICTRENEYLPEYQNLAIDYEESKEQN